LWDWKAGEHARPWGYVREGRILGFSPRGDRLLCTHRDEVSVREVPTGREVRRFANVNASCFVALSPDGKTFAAEWTKHNIRIWDVPSSAERPGLELHEMFQVNCAAFSPDGRLLAWSTGVGMIHLRDVVTGRDVAGGGGHQSPVESVAFSPDGKQ